MVGWHHRLDGHEFEQAPVDGDGQGSLVPSSSAFDGACEPHRQRDRERRHCIYENTKLQGRRLGEID